MDIYGYDEFRSLITEGFQENRKRLDRVESRLDGIEGQLRDHRKMLELITGILEKEKGTLA